MNTQSQDSLTKWEIERWRIRSAEFCGSPMERVSEIIPRVVTIAPSLVKQRQSSPITHEHVRAAGMAIIWRVIGALLARIATGTRALFG